MHLGMQNLKICFDPPPPPSRRGFPPSAPSPQKSRTAPLTQCNCPPATFTFPPAIFFFFFHFENPVQPIPFIRWIAIYPLDKLIRYLNNIPWCEVGVEWETFGLRVGGVETRFLRAPNSSFAENRKVLGSTPDRSTRIFFRVCLCHLLNNTSFLNSVVLC